MYHDRTSAGVDSTRTTGLAVEGEVKGSIFSERERDKQTKWKAKQECVS